MTDELPVSDKLSFISRSLTQLSDMIGEYERRCEELEAKLPPPEVLYGDEPLSDEDAAIEEELRVRTHRVEAFHFMRDFLREEGVKLAKREKLPEPVESPVRVLRPFG
jgi:hypothetical protein